MRAKEFINESYRQAKISKRQDAATVGMNLFRDPDGYDRTYELNRMMMALASADGSGDAINVDSESWVGKDNAAAPYTQLEQDMLKQAAKAIGTELKDLNHGDLRSRELDSVYKSSPVQAFKGWGK
jgi:hypothetical protein